MATYNLINSTVASDFVEGTSGNDSIRVYGNHSTVQAAGGNDIISVNGGRHDNGVYVNGGETNLIYAGTGDDSIWVQSRGASIYGNGGNDTINFAGSYVYADGGEGDDVFYRSSENNAANNVTITTGTGADTLHFRQYFHEKFEAVVTDFSNDDAIVITQHNAWDYGRDGYGALSYVIENGNVVISDNASINSAGDMIMNAIAPTFTVTLQGVGSISEVANANFARYNVNTPLEVTTLGELFGVEPIDTNTTVAVLSTDTGTTWISPPYYAPGFEASDWGDEVSTTIRRTETTTTTTIEETIISARGNSYNYSGGNGAIVSYHQGEVINISTNYTGIGLVGNNFYINSSSGSLEIQNSRDKVIQYNTNGNGFANYSYIASSGGYLDGSWMNQTAMIIGADNVDNQIAAGSGGSSLWGGAGGNDLMIGGAGYDEFFYATGNGNDTITNFGANDLVNVGSISISQVVGYTYDSNAVNVQFTDGGNLRVERSEMSAQANYCIENQIVTFDFNTGNWR